MTPALPLANFTSLDDAWVRQLATDSLPAPVLAGLGSGAYALVVLADSTTGEDPDVCHATAWIAPFEERHKNPRVATLRHEAMIALPREPGDEREECERQVVAQVLADMAQTPWAITRLQAEETRSGRPRKGVEPALPGKVMPQVLGAPGETAAATRALTDFLRERAFATTFDYREVQPVLLFSRFRTPDAIVCVATVGLSGRPFAGYAVHLPVVRDGGSATRPTAGLDRAGQTAALNACVADATRQAARRLLSRPWTPQGLLLEFAATEDREGIR